MRREFELASNDVIVQHVSHNATVTATAFLYFVNTWDIQYHYLHDYSAGILFRIQSVNQIFLKIIWKRLKPMTMLKQLFSNSGILRG